METVFHLETDPNCDDKISKVLLIHDGGGQEGHEVVNFITAQGYHVVTLKLTDDMFKSMRDFVREFEVLIKTEVLKKYVYAVVHYSRTDVKDICMYCNKITQKNSLLLKQAFAGLYVAMGREKCALICPRRCCSYASGHLPEAQVEGMAIYTTPSGADKPSSLTGPVMSLASSSAHDSTPAAPQSPTRVAKSGYHDEVWFLLQAKLDTLRQIAR
jgi:hypothetical protein